MENSRTKKSLKNSSFALLYFTINLVLQFYSRKVFLDYLGAEILGLNTTALNLLQFLNLAELGITSAVGFTLYKPIKDNNIEEIIDIISLQGHLYKRIGLLIMAGAIILMAFFPIIFKKIHLPVWYSYASFSVLLFSSLLGYFFNYKQILLSASQQNYKITISYDSIMIIKTCVQIIAVVFFKNPYVWWLGFEVLFSILGTISLQKITQKSYPYLSKSSLTFLELRKKYVNFVIKVKQLFFHKIIAVIITQSSPIVIYAYTSLSLVAVYGNYLLLINGITRLFNTIFNSIGAGIGSLVISADRKKVFMTFEELFSLRIFIVSVLSICVFLLATSFIKLWVGAEYILNRFTLLLMILIMVSTLTRYTVESFLLAYGLVKDIYSPIIEGCLNLGFSIVGGYYWGLNGILSGTLLSLIIIGQGWKPFFLFTSKLKGFYYSYLKSFFKHIFLICLIFFLLYWPLNHLILNNGHTWFGFIFSSIVVFVSIVVGLGSVLIMTRCGLRDVIIRILGLIREKNTDF